MIRLDSATIAVDAPAGRRMLLDGASFEFGPGLRHLDGHPTGDARLLVRFLAGTAAPDDGHIVRRGLRSWPLGETAPLGFDLTGDDTIEGLCSLYDLERDRTARYFRELLDHPEWLGRRLDRWPTSARRQFGHAAFLAPAFDIYLLDLSPVLPDGAFYRRWRALFRARTAGKTVIAATGRHRAARRDFPGETVTLASGVLRAEAATMAEA
jgi:ABC-type polysaccharide/polyol phosphate transport system ATPase subunit